jgi:hypothetical protein
MAFPRVPKNGFFGEGRRKRAGFGGPSKSRRRCPPRFVGPRAGRRQRPGGLGAFGALRGDVFSGRVRGRGIKKEEVFEESNAPGKMAGGTDEAGNFISDGGPRFRGFSSKPFETPDYDEDVRGGRKGGTPERGFGREGSGERSFSDGSGIKKRKRFSRGRMPPEKCQGGLTKPGIGISDEGPSISRVFVKTFRNPRL